MRDFLTISASASPVARHLAVTVASVATVAPPVPPGRRVDASRLGGGGPAPRPGESGAFVRKMGLVTVPFWVYWTSPYSSHYRPYT